MDAAMTALQELVALVGQPWLSAAGAAFLVMIFESAKARPVEGEEEPRASAFQRVAMIASLVTPFLLFLHAFGAFVLAHQTGQDSVHDGPLLLALIIGAIVFVTLPGIIGWLIASASPSVAKALRATAPWFALAVFAFTIFATYRKALFVLNLYVLSHLS